MKTNHRLRTGAGTHRPPPRPGVPRPAVAGRRGAAQHHRHPLRRHGLLRPRLLRRRDPHAEPRPAGRRTGCASRSSTTRPAAARRGPSLLTGLYPHQAGIGHMMEDQRLRRLPRRPEPQLRDHRRGAASRPATAPTPSASGTSRATASPTAPSTTGRCSAASTASTAPSPARAASSIPARSRATTRCISPYADPEYQPARLLLHRRHQRPRGALRRRASARAAPAQPFFLYVAYTAAHWPMHALESDIAKYRGKYDAGYEPIRQRALREGRSSSA